MSEFQRKVPATTRNRIVEIGHRVIVHTIRPDVSVVGVINYTDQIGLGIETDADSQLYFLPWTSVLRIQLQQTGKE